MLLSIITINRNNACGLRRTLRSVLAQTRKDFEYILVDGNSTDDSLSVILEFANLFGQRFKWISEDDIGIYNAMNKGLKMASGDYIQFLNSGDCLVAEGVTERMIQELINNGSPSILYGNMLKEQPSGIIKDKCFAGKEITLLGFYTGTLNHSSAYIRKELFEKYGLYDENLKIVSDWKWFLKAIILGEERPVYTDIDITLFDMQGISETNKELSKAERRRVLVELISPAILSDYDNWASSIYQIKRVKRHIWVYKFFWFIERCLFKWERIINRRSKTQEWQ